MKPAPFELHRARTVAEAIELLGSFPGREVKPIAGGQSLVPLLNFRLARPDHLVDLSAVEELTTIAWDDGRIRVGSMVTQRQLLETPGLSDDLPLLTAAVAEIGHGHIRNRGTIGGSLAHADPAAELPAVALALGAELVVEGPSGRRTIAAQSFFTGWLSTALGDDELLVEVSFPVMAPPSGADEPGGSVEWGFEELARRAGDFAMVLVSTVVQRNAGGQVTDARVVAGGVGATPLRCNAAEATLVGSIGSEGFDQAAAAARAELDPAHDVHADTEYRSEMIEVLIGRSLASARPVGVSPTSPPEGVARATLRERATEQGPAQLPDRVAPEVTVNGTVESLAGVPDRWLLADWLRDELGLTGTHLGCEHGVCGACTVLLDGDPVRSCLTFAQQTSGREITTIEQLGTPVELHPIQEAFRTHHGLQCGFCTPGMVLSTLDLLARIPDPTEEQIRGGLSGNICRCTGYVNIVHAVKAAAVNLGAPDTA